MNDKSILGIDAAKEKVDVVLLQGDQVRGRTFGNTPTGHGKLWQWLTKHDATTCHACMEATGVYGEALALFLHERKGKASWAGPRPTRPTRLSSLGSVKR